LLNIGKNMQSLKGSEKSFYEDQLNARECRLSDEMDIEYAEEIEARQQEQYDLNKTLEANLAHAFGDDDEYNEVVDAHNSTLNNTSINRSGLSRITLTTSDASVQTDQQHKTED